MNDVYGMYKDIGISDRGLTWNTDLVEALELENLLCILMKKIFLLIVFFSAS